MFFLFGSLTTAQNLKKRPKTLKNPLTPIGSCRDLHMANQTKQTGNRKEQHVVKHICAFLSNVERAALAPRRERRDPHDSPRLRTTQDDHNNNTLKSNTATTTHNINSRL